MKGKVVYGSYWEHLNDAWKHCNHPNLKILWYEDMIDDLPKVIQDVADFTNYKISMEQIERLTDHCSIEKFKENDAINFRKGFIRKGHVGDWINHFKDQEKLKD